MKVRAIKPGFYGSDYKNVGDTFEVPDGTKSKWFVKDVTDTTEQASAKGAATQGNPRGGGFRQKSDTTEPGTSTSSQ
ncbi:hypothetical protein Q9R35_00875 [Alcaligenes sp. AB3]|uniref:hypothetical protein n=1 Tax=Alcaligenes sp. AB3 TaxID=2962569 RepID=UPI002882CDC1|nr:hypothetical protein [Alcaligenes sp. AB3]MDT0215864.1 hypothetical protein [Alcaligenes sp. AB3]